MPDRTQVHPHGPAGADSSVPRLPGAVANGLAGPFEAATVVVVRRQAASHHGSLTSHAPMRLGVVWPELETASLLVLLVLTLFVLVAVVPRGDLHRVVSNWWSGTPSLPASEFQIGSTQQQVRAVQGAPTAVDGSVWRYGRSEVHFIGGRVAGWKTSPEHPLKTVPAIPVRFAQGSPQP